MSFSMDLHKSQKVLHLGCEEPRAYFIPYEDEKTALEDIRDLSGRYLSLCGDWNFRFYSTPAEIEDFTAEGFGIALPDKMTVPRSWQTVQDKGYDTPNYTNVRYPFPVDPPHVPDNNPCALYARSFYVGAEFAKDREIFVNFEGVDSCFYLYVNDKFVGYSQVSHMTSEFNVTEAVTAGENTIKVLVFKWCDGSYLEDQDKFRFSGIFREVYLLSRDKTHITDIYCRPVLNEKYTQGVLNVSLNINGRRKVSYRLLGTNGLEESAGSVTVSGSGEFEILVASPKLWSDEEPNLYTLIVRCGDEVIVQKPGFRDFTVRGKVIYINGKKVKARGVNRHDSHPYLGSATPLDHMLNDLYILKRHNVNMIRTSHYPNDPRFPGLCDRLGFFLCDETDYECHGMQPAGDWDYFSREPEWTESLVDRVKRLFERDKNHACVLFWSLGNESGMGDNQRKMSEYVKSRMPSAIIHCEDVSRRLHGQNKMGLPNTEEECPWVDVESRMYPHVSEILAYIKNKKFTKPFYLCEYCHAMGNGPGDFKAYWDAIRAHDEFFGGCVWEFLDHSVATGDNIYADPHFIYGGDYGDFPHDGNFCVDGLVYPDRRPHTGMLEYKQIIAPFGIGEVAPDGSSFRIKNRRYFRGLDDLSLSWTVECDGKIIAKGSIPSLAVKPQYSRKYETGFAANNLSGNCYINFSVRQITAEEWAEAGYEVGFAQFELEAAKETTTLAPAKNTAVLVFEDSDKIVVKSASSVYTILKKDGLIVSVTDNGREMLASPVTPAIWRAPTDNDRRIKADWHGAGFDRAVTKCYSCAVTASDEGSVTVSADISLGAAYIRPILRMTVEYVFVAGEGVDIRTDVNVREGQPPLPRFGMQFLMPEGSEQLRYYGRGPVESYIDKRLASREGLFATTVSEHFEHYVRPQENMAHTDTLWTSVSNLSGHGLLAVSDGETFSFNCCHFTPKQLTETPHDYELVPMKETCVNIDFRHTGIGSNSCGPSLEPSLRFSDTHFSFSFRLKPANVNNVNPFAEALKRM